MSLRYSTLAIVAFCLLAATLAAAEPKKIVFIAGVKSHGYGAHEHKAGCMLLAADLNSSGLGVKTEVYTDGWPPETSLLGDADTIVVYADGGGRHPLNAHLEEIDKLMDRGVGLVCIHYGVEVPKGKSGDAFLEWIGGYFEPNWSVNPHWTAEYAKLPDHAISRGVKPFAINDEWYYHMRFPEQMAGVTPILTDLPPDSTLARPDGPHSGNAAVRKAISEKQPQHMAWATERPGGGRGFGFTGGHFHWNWGNPHFRKLVLNAIVWTAKVEVPLDGVPVRPLSVEDLMANQDEPVPENFNRGQIEKLLADWNK
jgi:type 1 glutamine amidotransferase